MTLLIILSLIAAIKRLQGGQGDDTKSSALRNWQPVFTRKAA